MLCLVVLQVRDPEYSKDFYSLLGLSFLAEQHGAGVRHYAAQMGNQVLEIYPCRADQSPSSIRLGFSIDAPERAMERIRQKGAKVISELKDSPWGRRGVVEDPDGNRLELFDSNISHRTPIRTSKPSPAMHIVKKLAAVGFLLFLILWIAGFCRTFVLESSDLPNLNTAMSISPISSGGDYRLSTRNAHNLTQVDLGQTPLPKVLDQEDIGQIAVFEKTAHIASGTTTFAEDEVQIRKAIGTHKALIFSEKANGIAPQRRIVLGIGVAPDRFDSFLKALLNVGHLESVDVQQQDRTSEFRKLHGQRLALKKHREAILKVRDTSKMSVDEALKMEQRIVEIDKEIQTIGVQLGDFLAKEPSYNIFLTLQEGQPGSHHDREFTIARRAGSGFLWAAAWWFLAAVGAALVAGVVASISTLRSIPVAVKVAAPESQK